jgi:tRNA(Ile2) C34 agmatinyltransferase TiaS
MVRIIVCDECGIDTEIEGGDDYLCPECAKKNEVECTMEMIV